MDMLTLGQLIGCGEKIVPDGINQALVMALIATEILLLIGDKVEAVPILVLTPTWDPRLPLSVKFP
jgi:hypothetical protein